METELKVVTLNCWGIPMVSKHRRTRMAAIAEVLVAGNYDMVCLQEIWSDADYHMIKEKVSGVLPFSHYFYSGVAGSGVCILARHCIQNAFFHQWPVNGYMHKICHGDWFGGKGIGLCRFKIKGFNIDVYAAHLHAEYNRKHDEYLAHRVLQAFDTAQFVQLTSAAADLVILAGDFNSEPHQLPYKIIVNITPVTDSFLVADQIHHEPPGTTKRTRNTYTHTSVIETHCSGVRIDYVTYRAGARAKATLKKYSLPLPERIPNHTISYSDHEAVCAVLQLRQCENCPLTVDKETQKALLTEAIVTCERALRTLRCHKCVYCFCSLVLVGLLVATFLVDAPFGYPVVYHVARFLICALLFYMLVMGSLWNCIERSGIRAGIVNMEVYKMKLEQRR